MRQLTHIRDFKRFLLVFCAKESWYHPRENSKVSYPFCLPLSFLRFHVKNPCILNFWIVKYDISALFYTASYVTILKSYENQFILMEVKFWKSVMILAENFVSHFFQFSSKVMQVSNIESHKFYRSSVNEVGPPPPWWWGVNFIY